MWGAMSGGVATACSDHKSNVLGSPVIHFRALCTVAGCTTFCKWGLSGEQPSHCRSHGPLVDGLTLTVPTIRNKSVCRNSPESTQGDRSLGVKAECYF
ncbi:unnamed protein product [Laminaria digitata]